MDQKEPLSCFGDYKPQCNTAYCKFMYKCEEKMEETREKPKCPDCGGIDHNWYRTHLQCENCGTEFNLRAEKKRRRRE